MAKRGRRSKYDEYVKPLIPKIEEWARAGATEKEICSALGISLSTFYEYKKQYSELSRAVRAGRQNVVLDIKAAMYKRACGFEYEEKKGYNKITGDGEDGDKVIMTEINKKYLPPDPTAAAMLLRNYDPTWKDKDKVTTDFKQREIELREAIAKANYFDYEIDNKQGGDK